MLLQIPIYILWVAWFAEMVTEIGHDDAKVAVQPVRLRHRGPVFLPYQGYKNLTLCTMPSNHGAVVDLDPAWLISFSAGLISYLGLLIWFVIKVKKTMDRYTEHLTPEEESLKNAQFEVEKLEKLQDIIIARLKEKKGDLPAAGERRHISVHDEELTLAVDLQLKSERMEDLLKHLSTHLSKNEVLLAQTMEALDTSLSQVSCLTDALTEARTRESELLTDLESSQTRERALVELERQEKELIDILLERQASLHNSFSVRMLKTSQSVRGFLDMNLHIVGELKKKTEECKMWKKELRKKLIDEKQAMGWAVKLSPNLDITLSPTSLPFDSPTHPTLGERSGLANDAWGSPTKDRSEQGAGIWNEISEQVEDLLIGVGEVRQQIQQEEVELESSGSMSDVD